MSPPARLPSTPAGSRRDADLNVAVGHSRLMNERLKAAGKQVTYVEFDELDHQLDTAEARTRLLSDSDRFIRTALGL